MKTYIKTFLPSLTFSSPFLTSLTFLLIFCAMQVATAQIPSSGLVGYWPFNGNANDESGNGNNGTVNGATLTTDRFGNANSAYSFDGVNDFIQTSNISFANGGDFSISTWVNLAEAYANGFPQHYILANNAAGGGAYLNTDGNLSQFGCYDINTTITLNNWHHFVAIKSGINYNLYIDNVFVGVNSNCNTNFINGVPIFFGKSSVNSEFTHGKIDDISIYNRALTPTEITQLYTDQTSLVEVPCTAFLGEDQTVCAGETVTLNATSAVQLSVLDSLTYLGQNDGHYYYLTNFTSNPQGQVGTELTPAEMQSIISASGAYLATIQSSQENSFIANSLPPDLFAVWIGLSDYIQEGSYVWLNGTPASYYAWRSGEPNNSGNEDFTIMYGATSYPGAFSLWNDEPCGEGSGSCNPFYFVIESDAPLQVNSDSFVWSTGATTPTINVSPTSTTTYTCTVTTNGVSCTDEVTVVVSQPVASITPNGIVEICQGQSIALTANGGVSYLWNTGASTQSITVNTEAVYTVTVTDANGCTDTESQLVKVNFPPNIAVNNASICSGQSATLTATGGLSYAWSPATGLSSTTGTTVTASPSTSTVYTVTGTGANGCTNTATAAVTVNAAPTATITPATATTFCQGGSVVLNANTGAGLSYQWRLNGTNITGATSSTYTANASGSYTVVVTNTSTCSATSTATVVTVNALPTATITPATATTFCQGGSVVLTANTGTGLSYQWFNNAVAISGATSSSYTANASGSYTVVVTNTSTCSATSAATAVTVNTLPSATITPATATTFCQGGSVVLTANTGAGLSYQWFNNATAISAAISASYTATISGSYTVTVTNASTCSSTSSAIDVTTIPNIDYYADTDGDGYGDVTTLLSTCVQPQGYVTNSGDCNDINAAIFSGAQEICNDIDDDCNQLIDDGLVFTTYYADVDGDSFGDINNPLDACMMPAGYVTNNTDCNDNNVNQNAAAAEICNGEDDDCDGTIDNGVTFFDYYTDADGDGFGSGDVISSCSDLGAGYVSNNTDCDDANGNTYPGATELCNTIDDNCDGQIDEGVQTVYFIDNDGDTYGNPSVSILACTQPIGYTPDDSDCNDTDANINPGAEDIGGNGIDENCDGQIDNSVLELNATISLYPNPTRSELNIQVNSSIIGNDLYIFDAVGKLVFKQQLLSTQTTVPVSNFADGNYVVRVGEVVKRFEVMK